MSAVHFQDSWDRIESADDEYGQFLNEIDQTMRSQVQRMIRPPSSTNPNGVGIQLLHPKELIELTNRPRVLAGQIAENLRSALDYIVFHLSERNEEALNARLPAFVIADDAASFQRSSGTALKYLNAEQRTIIEGLQPYQGHVYMAVIRDASNTSKHRGLLTLHNFTPAEIVVDTTGKAGEYKGWWHFVQPNGQAIYVKRGNHDVQLLGKYNATVALKYMLDCVKAVAWSFEHYLNTGSFLQIVVGQVR